MKTISIDEAIEQILKYGDYDADKVNDLCFEELEEYGSSINGRNYYKYQNHILLVISVDNRPELIFWLCDENLKLIYKIGIAKNPYNDDIDFLIYKKDERKLDE